MTFDLEKLIVSELFYIAFVHRIQQGQGVQLYTQFKNEAFQAVCIQAYHNARSNYDFRWLNL